MIDFSVNLHFHINTNLIDPSWFYNVTNGDFLYLLSLPSPYRTTKRTKKSKRHNSFMKTLIYLFTIRKNM